MSIQDIGKTEYVPPLLVVIEMTETIEKLGPALSCSGYGGAATGCN